MNKKHVNLIYNKITSNIYLICVGYYYYKKATRHFTLELNCITRDTNIIKKIAFNL